MEIGPVAEVTAQLSSSLEKTAKVTPCCLIRSEGMRWQSRFRSPSTAPTRRA